MLVEASGFFVSGITVEGYINLPIICFALCYRTRISEKTDKASSISAKLKVVVREGNFNESSRAMEHFILDSILQDAMLQNILVEENLKLEITIDGDLACLSYLCGLDIVAKVTLDFSHKKKTSQNE